MSTIQTSTRLSRIASLLSKARIFSSSAEKKTSQFSSLFAGLPVPATLFPAFFKPIVFETSFQLFVHVFHSTHTNCCYVKALRRSTQSSTISRVDLDFQQSLGTQTDVQTLSPCCVSPSSKGDNVHFPSPSSSFVVWSPLGRATNGNGRPPTKQAPLSGAKRRTPTCEGGSVVVCFYLKQFFFLQRKRFNLQEAGQPWALFITALVFSLCLALKIAFSWELSCGEGEPKTIMNIFKFGPLLMNSDPHLKTCDKTSRFLCTFHTDARH